MVCAAAVDAECRVRTFLWGEWMNHQFNDNFSERKETLHSKMYISYNFRTLKFLWEKSDSYDERHVVTQK